MSFATSNLEELILPLRVQIGDTTSSPTYSDETLHEILKNAVINLMRRWNERYYLTNEGVVTRSSTETFYWSSPPVIEQKDRRPIILQASIMIKSGKKFSTSGNAVSWRDEEIQYSNMEGARQLSSSLKDDMDELDSLLPIKLARAKYGRLYGWNHEYD